MSDKILVVFCNHYRLELKSVLSEKGFEGYLAIHAPPDRRDPARCHQAKDFITNLLHKYQTTHLIGGSCLSIPPKVLREHGGVNLQKASQCHYLLASEAIVDSLQSQGAYLVSPGWLISWQKIIENWGFDRKTAQEFFSETTSKIVLLDTGIYENSGENLKDFAEFLDLPYETLYVGLDHLKMYLKIVLHDLKSRSALNEKDIIQKGSDAASYAMALEMVGQLSKSKSASETVQQTIDIFNMLFSPERTIFHSQDESIPSPLKQFQFEGLTCLTNNEQGFLVKISLEGKIYGVFEIVNVALPQHLKEYINLTLNLIGVVSLALKEATYKEKLLATTEQLEWELAVNAALSKISSDLINHENDLEYLTHLILEQAQKLTGSDHGFVSVIDEKTGDNIGYTLTEMMGSSCRIEGENKKIAFPIGDDGTYKSLWGHTLNIRTGFFTNDPNRHQDTTGIPEGHVEIEKFLSIPAVAGEKLVGQIALANPGRDYSERDLLAITRLANLYSLALEQKRVEDINARMAAIVESSDDAILGKTLDGIIISWNPAAEKLYGYSEEEAVGQSISILVPDDRAVEVEKFINQIRKGELVERFETIRIRRDGEKIDVSLNISPIKDKKGAISGASSIAMDISERKKAETALREAELTRDLALDAAGVGVFDWDVRNDALIWDETLYHLFGVSKQDFSCAHDVWINGLHPDDKERVEEDVQLALQSEKDYNSEFRIIWQDGSVHYLNGRAIVQRDTSGDPVRLLGVNSDITEIKKLEEELRQHSLMVTSIQDSIIVTDLERRITHWNKGSEIMFGFTENEAIGKTPSIIYKPEENEKFRTEIYNALQSEGVWTGEVNFVRKDSKTGYCSSTIVPMQNDKGNRIGALGINRDITAQKIAEEEITLHSEIMKNMAEGVYLIGADDGLIKYANPKFEKMFGYGPGEMIGQHASIVNAPIKKDPLETAQEIMEILNETGAWYGEIENKKKDGTHFWCDANVSVFNHQLYGRVLVAVHSDITERKENEEKVNALTADLERQKKQLELLASTDSLTGLLNRRSFTELLESEVIRQQRSNKTFSIVMSDIDNFKNLNDSYGHPFGDAVLINVADTLKAHIREQDSVSRWGGEEFILLLPETDLKGALILSDKIREILEKSDNRFEGTQVTVTATFGISECRPKDNYLESIKRADQALYEGKKAGRNCVMSAPKI